VTTTDEILAVAARTAATAGRATGVTDADLAAFGAAAARGADSAVVRALLTARPATGPWAPPPAAPAGDLAWNAWLTAAAAMADPAGLADGKEPGGPARLATFAVAAALAGPTGNAPGGVSARTAAAAGIRAAAITESGLADWDGWSSGTVAAAIGAGLTAALLLGLTQPQLRAALGICATQAAGLRAAAATPAFSLQVGKAAFNGVEAARLARSGLTAPDEPLDGRRGLFALFG
jgi:hypothetical protein